MYKPVIIDLLHGCCTYAHGLKDSFKTVYNILDPYMKA